ncbi:unnamed protein product [Enterobius vermicularis]|uniref:RPEL repeat protein n=1 Tax=Enterobius vermicularis TaxID=51028 RepID=A0A0N4V2F6_ENTVE|nr:unnamed protein product [Enterobius vermicularis]
MVVIVALLTAIMQWKKPDDKENEIGLKSEHLQSSLSLPEELYSNKISSTNMTSIYDNSDIINLNAPPRLQERLLEESMESRFLLTRKLLTEPNDTPVRLKEKLLEESINAPRSLKEKLLEDSPDAPIRLREKFLEERKRPQKGSEHQEQPVKQEPDEVTEFR